MTANDFFSNATGIPRPYSVSQQWGADIGGPAIKDRLFWYVDSEGLYYTLPTSAETLFTLAQGLIHSLPLGDVTDGA
jgi:hypothetical protein